MQLYQAAFQYHNHHESLYNYAEGCFINDYVWQVYPHEKGYFLQLHPAVSQLPADGSDEAWENARTITRQRGGTRYFQTLDAVASALQQIGQSVMPLDYLPLPTGLEVSA